MTEQNKDGAKCGSAVIEDTILLSNLSSPLPVWSVTEQSTLKMDEHIRFITVAQASHDPLNNAKAFVPLALTSSLDGKVLLSLFWLGITCHQPMELLDTGNLHWKEAIIRCLESLQSRAGIMSAAADSSPERPPVPAPRQRSPVPTPRQSPLRSRSSQSLFHPKSPRFQSTPQASALPERPPKRPRFRSPNTIFFWGGCPSWPTESPDLPWPPESPDSPWPAELPAPPVSPYLVSPFLLCPYMVLPVHY